MYSESLWKVTVHESEKRSDSGTKEQEMGNQGTENQGTRASGLQADYKTDVLIIGAGIAGILCAYQLKQAGIDCVVVEQGETGCGVTKNTTAKITAQHRLVYHKILQRYGEERALAYYTIQKRALDTYKTLVQSVSCDFEEKTAFVYSVQDREKLEREQRVYEKLGIPYVFQEKLPLPIETVGALGMEHQAQFHPLKFLEKLAEPLTIYTHTPVLDIRGHKAVTPHGSITADRIILATHYPMVNVPGLYFMKLYQHRSYVIALEHAPQIHGMYIDEASQGFSFRNYKNFLLIGGGSHRTGRKGGGYQGLYEFAQQNYPNCRAAAEWATQDCMTLDEIPYIGKFSRNRPYLYVATGFQKWGMTEAMAAAIVLKDCIVKGKSEYEELFSPQRSMIHPQLFVNLAQTAVDFVTPGKRCSHLGCSLKWNPKEHTWDCPCHGSRFHENGEVINNPAKKPVTPICGEAHEDV